MAYVTPEQIRPGDVVREVNYGDVVVKSVETEDRPTRTVYWFDIGPQRVYGWLDGEFMGEKGRMLPTKIGCPAGSCLMKRVKKVESTGDGG